MAYKTVRVRRANVVLRVPEYDVNKYYAQGYSILDEAGNVVKASVPNDLGTLQTAYVRNAERIKDLEAEVAELKKKLTKPKKRQTAE